MGRRPKFHQRWFGGMFDGKKFCCDNGTEWELGEKISEKDTYNPFPLRKGKPAEAEAQAVYHCRQIVGQCWPSCHSQDPDASPSRVSP
ncbi:hypothetical protein AJ79_05580 [Helicocarpus griseus UAMH5409]|uniref:Uncharacterized protein n=1 Tax=Helicocarpus griseus UAMH5409 TaxID=1447875 RepID=A0A2B7XDX1_9EURO|nr:hypothetical protein AJ79_05580 [Helicocarpus griseus UAMH5409]